MHPQRFWSGTRSGQLTALGFIVAHLPAFAGTPQAQGTPIAALQVLIGTAACDTDDQCRTLAIGNRACGGPDAYLAWSVRQTDAVALRQAAARYNAARAAAQPPGGRISTCEFLSDPGAVCVPAAASPAASNTGAGKSCQLRPRSGPAALPAR